MRRHDRINEKANAMKFREHHQRAIQETLTFMTLQLRVTWHSICNSCAVWFIFFLFIQMFIQMLFWWFAAMYLRGGVAASANKDIKYDWTSYNNICDCIFTFREHPQRAIQEPYDPCNVWPLVKFLAIENNTNSLKIHSHVLEGWKSQRWNNVPRSQ